MNPTGESDFQRDLAITLLKKTIRQVIDEDRLDLAIEVVLGAEPSNRKAWFMVKLTRECNRRQARQLSYIIDEFVIFDETKYLRLVHWQEMRMYRRLKDRRGVERCLVRYLTEPKRGRGLLSGLNGEDLLPE